MPICSLVSPPYLSVSHDPYVVLYVPLVVFLSPPGVMEEAALNDGERRTDERTNEQLGPFSSHFFPSLFLSQFPIFLRFFLPLLRSHAVFFVNMPTKNKTKSSVFFCAQNYNTIIKG